MRRYPRAGDVFSGWIQGSSNLNDSLVLLYGVQDFENRYYARVDIDSGNLQIRKKEAGTITTLAEQTGLGLSLQAWYELEVDWGIDGTHVVTIYDTTGAQLGQVSVSNETRWTSGGIGYNAHSQNGGAAYFDHVTITETKSLGRFETGLDGWAVNGTNMLRSVSYNEEIAPVTEGDNALDVTIDNEPEPMIENRQWIQRADLPNYPCLLADVLPASVQNSNSPVTFRFRYHHGNPGGIEESPEMTVSQEYGGRIGWDMSGLNDTKLASPECLEIAWYPEDHPPSSNFDYNGRVCVDNVRLTDDHYQVELTRSTQKRRELERAHGVKVDAVVESETDTVQKGHFKYDDGTEKSYQLEILPNGELELTLDGETFLFEGGSA